MSETVNDAPQKLVVAGIADGMQRKPPAAYDGMMYLTHRPHDPYAVGVKHHVQEPLTVFSDQGLITQTNAIPTNPQYIFNPTMPNGVPFKFV